MPTLYQLVDNALKTHHRRADGTLQPLLAQSRRAPMRSAVKRYASLLELDATSAKPEDYHRPDDEIRELIDTKAPTHLAPHTRRNLANDVIALFRMAVEKKWLSPLPAPMLSWRQRLPLRGAIVPRGEQPDQPPYRLRLDECPPALRDELVRYVKWCEAPLSLGRDRHVAKRPSSTEGVYKMVCRLAGYAVHYLHQPVDTLTLAGLCQPAFLEHYVNWWFERRGKMTRGLDLTLITVKTIAKHWLKDAAVAQAIQSMQLTLPAIEPVREKEKRWLSLAELEKVGISVHPLNPRRLQDYPMLREPAYRRQHTKRRTALYVEFSLIIRLLVRLPMRQRCIREMQLGRNLFKDNAGTWQIRFVGKELKIAQVRGVTKRYEFPFPADLVPLLEEWLNEWRPKLMVGEHSYVFLNSEGKIYIYSHQIGNMMARTTYRFMGIGVTPHMIRDIWATEYLNTDRDAMGCARRLGNTPEVVMRHYAHILQKDADVRAESFLQGTLTPGKRK